MDTPATQHQPPVDAEAIAGQREHWAATFEANPDMYGTDPSASGLAAAAAVKAAAAANPEALGSVPYMSGLASNVAAQCSRWPAIASASTGG